MNNFTLIKVGDMVCFTMTVLLGHVITYYKGDFDWCLPMKSWQQSLALRPQSNCIVTWVGDSWQVLRAAIWIVLIQLLLSYMFFILNIGHQDGLMDFSITMMEEVRDSPSLHTMKATLCKPIQNKNSTKLSLRQCIRIYLLYSWSYYY